MPMLREMGRFLAEHAGNWTKLTVEGHTDSRGSESYNRRLSLRRAETVRSVLVEQGVTPSSITVEGFGPSRPRDAGSNEEAWRKNRRVDFKMEGINEPEVMDKFFRKLRQGE
jgi:outer membrane protein OmpA-like peptidoglycan-associated protein